jgi:flagella basal body P-ring formation protein FlgA
MRFLLVLLLGLQLPALAEAAVILRFHAEAQPSGMLVRLGDIADIATDSEAERSHLTDLTVSPGPAAGRSVRLTMADIRNRLQALGVDLSDIEFGGASSVLVRGTALERVEPEAKPQPRPAAPLRTSDTAVMRLKDRLAREVAAELDRRLPTREPSDISVELTSTQAEAIAAAFGTTVDGVAGWAAPALGQLTAPQLTGGDAPWTGTVPLQLTISTTAGQPAEFPILATITPWPRVVISKSHVVKGNILSAADVVAKPIPPRSMTTAAHSDPKAVIGRQVTRSIREGEPITAEMIREVPLVRRGETVTITARRGGIAVRSEAKASEDGSLGQTIPLVSRDGKQRLMGRVVAFHEVETVAGTGEPSGVKIVHAVAAEPVGVVTPPRNSK